MKRLVLALVTVCAVMLAVVSLTVAQAAPGPLAEYLARPESAFEWKKVAVFAAGSVRGYDLTLTSQEWHGIAWTHELHVFVPRKLRYPHWALLVIVGGSGPATGRSMRKSDYRVGVMLAEAIAAPVAVLTHVPNQPLFDGLSEDGLISYTFARFLESGDPSWPLLLPMAKSAIKAMDSVQQFMAAELKQEVCQFVVAGGSKRGWTTWLTAASGDPRVKAVIPMVIDTLNLPSQMAHQMALWGRYSENIDEYTKRGLQDQLAARRGLELIGIVDPYSYRAALTMPKLIINGANDRFWATDAITQYWDGLPGPKALLDVPNSDHGLQDKARVIGSAVSFFRAIAGDTPFPYPTWEHGESADELTLAITSSPAPREGRIWIATSTTKDFRDRRWRPVKMKLKGNTLTGTIRKPRSGSIAFFGEATYRLNRRIFNLSTAPRIYPALSEPQGRVGLGVGILRGNSVLNRTRL